MPRSTPGQPSGRFLPRALVILLRRSRLRSWGIRSARVYAALMSIGVVVTIWIMVAKFGPDGMALSLVARSAAMLTWIPGGACALALAAPPRDAALAQGVAALAMARGLDDRSIARAETEATVRLLMEVIVFPVVVIGLFVFVVVAGAKLEAAASTIAGSVVFAVLASVVLGLVASGCRRWGGIRGRSWLLAVVFFPWLLSELVGSGRIAPYLSIPGLLGQLWEALTKLPS